MTPLLLDTPAAESLDPMPVQRPVLKKITLKYSIINCAQCEATDIASDRLTTLLVSNVNFTGVTFRFIGER